MVCPRAVEVTNQVPSEGLAALPGAGRGAMSDDPVFQVSHLYGFGLVDAEALVLAAKKWTAVPGQHACVAVTDKRPR